MTAHSQEHAEFKAVLGELDAAFAAGDAAAFGALLADDTQVMWNDRETIVGRQAVHDAFAGLFSAVDTSEWRPDHHTIEVYADGAYVMSDFIETLRPADGGHAVRVRGRAVFFWRRTEIGWRLTRLLTARSAPDEEVL
jgi:ketosteroid isomerase-like protein